MIVSISVNPKEGCACIVTLDKDRALYPVCSATANKFALLEDQSPTICVTVPDSVSFSDLSLALICRSTDPADPAYKVQSLMYHAAVVTDASQIVNLCCGRLAKAGGLWFHPRLISLVNDVVSKFSKSLGNLPASRSKDAKLPLEIQDSVMSYIKNIGLASSVFGSLISLKHGKNEKPIDSNRLVLQNVLSILQTKDMLCVQEQCRYNIENGKLSHYSNDNYLSCYEYVLDVIQSLKLHLLKNKEGAWEINLSHDGVSWKTTDALSILDVDGWSYTVCFIGTLIGKFIDPSLNCDDVYGLELYFGSHVAVLCFSNLTGTIRSKEDGETLIQSFNLKPCIYMSDDVCLENDKLKGVVLISTRNQTLDKWTLENTVCIAIDGNGHDLSSSSSWSQSSTGKYDRKFKRGDNTASFFFKTNHKNFVLSSEKGAFNKSGRTNSVTQPLRHLDFKFNRKEMVVAFALKRKWLEERLNETVVRTSKISEHPLSAINTYSSARAFIKEAGGFEDCSCNSIVVQVEFFEMIRACLREFFWKDIPRDTEGQNAILDKIYFSRKLVIDGEVTSNTSIHEAVPSGLYYVLYQNGPNYQKYLQEQKKDMEKKKFIENEKRKQEEEKAKHEQQRKKEAKEKQMQHDLDQQKKEKEKEEKGGWFKLW